MTYRDEAMRAVSNLDDKVSGVLSNIASDIGCIIDDIEKGKTDLETVLEDLKDLRRELS